MGTNSRCEIRSLARSEVCSVEYCPGSGMFHVSLGMFTLRFRLAALHLLNSTLAAGLEAYKSHLSTRLTSAIPQQHPEGTLH